MTGGLSQRLNQILPQITSEAFLSSQGIGNEIACYIFDYPAEDELAVREHIQMMVGRLVSHHAQLSVLHLNLLDVVLAYLEQRGLLDRVLEMQVAKGDAAVLRALHGPLSADKVRDFIAATNSPADFDLVLLSGVGSVWPMLRVHSLLNCLHTIMAETPLVMFYPGMFDGTTLRLFDRVAPGTSKPGSKPYYRAFRLIPGDAQA